MSQADVHPGRESELPAGVEYAPDGSSTLRVVVAVAFRPPARGVHAAVLRVPWRKLADVNPIRPAVVGAYVGDAGRGASAVGGAVAVALSVGAGARGSTEGDGARSSLADGNAESLVSGAG